MAGVGVGSPSTSNVALATLVGDPQLAVHASVVAACIYLTLRTVYDVGVRSHAGLFGVAGGVDLSDTQWRGYREGLPHLAIALMCFAAVSRALRRVAAPEVHGAFYLAAGLGFAGYLHGASVVYPVGICCGVYALIRGVLVHLPRSLAGGILWAVVISVLFYADAAGGFYKHPPPFAEAWYTRDVKRVFKTHKGVYRWHLGFNLAVLRIISFGADYLEAVDVGHHAAAPRHATLDGKSREGARAASTPDKTEASDAQEKPRCPVTRITSSLDADTPGYAHRQNTPLARAEYTLSGMLGYVFYPPLLIAGPITTYNAWRSHQAVPQSGLSPAYLVVYALRLGVCLVLLEAGSRYFHVWAIAGSPPVRDGLDSFELLSLGLTLLNALWLKFAVFWRIGRLFAVCDGVEVPENMTRCLQNNVHSVAGFWRNWHRSFNKWIVRYMYVPLGGRAWRAFNVAPIFLFVAAWHDLELRLVKWGLLIALCIIPEVALEAYFTAPGRRWMHARPWWRPLRTAAGAVNNTALMLANLIGFGWMGDTRSAGGGHTAFGGADPPATVITLTGTLAYAFVLFYSTTYLACAVREWEGARASPRPPAPHTVSNAR